MPLKNRTVDKPKNMIIIDAIASYPLVGDDVLRQHN